MCKQLPTHYEITWQDLAATKAEYTITNLWTANPELTKNLAEGETPPVPMLGISLSLPYTRETAAALFALARNFNAALSEVENAREAIAAGTFGYKKG